jgi:tRNA (guanine37-N1)-methyltransferase
VPRLEVEILTLFPRMCAGYLAESILGKAQAAGVLEVAVRDVREHAAGKHRVTDDAPYGGGAGMVMKAEPLARAVEEIRTRRGAPDAVVLLSPQGRPFRQAEAARMSGLSHVVLLCGRYEGMDERVRELVATDELSIGDYVLSGGELPALVIIDAISRLVPGVVGDEQSVEQDSFSDGVLDYPHYTRPAEFGGLKVPDVLLSGHHAAVRRWRRKTALARTWERRPELLDEARLDQDDRALLEEIKRESDK